MFILCITLLVILWLSREVMVIYSDAFFCPPNSPKSRELPVYSDTKKRKATANLHFLDAEIVRLSFLA